MKRICLLAVAVLAIGLARCSGSSSTPTPLPVIGSDVGGGDHSVAVLVGAGDIGDCAQPGSEATARLLDRIPGTVFTTGDNAYPSGRAVDFQNCYHPTWGRHRARTRPSPGNHEYETPGASGYFDYFGTRAGPRGLGYYGYTVGSWHIIALNSELPVHAGSAQVEWLREELSSSNRQCTAAYWHRPRFSSGMYGDDPSMGELWRTLHEFRADVVITGHEHSYERFAPLDATGRPDPARGIRQFIIGTGGTALRSHRAPRAGSESRGSAWGVLVLTLGVGNYQWEFVPVDGATFRDSGVGQCH